MLRWKLPNNVRSFQDTNWNKITSKYGKQNNLKYIHSDAVGHYMSSVQ